MKRISYFAQKIKKIINFIKSITYHTLGKKIHENSQSRGLKWPRVSQKNLTNLHEQKKAITKIVTILLNQKKEKDSQKTYN